MGFAGSQFHQGPGPLYINDPLKPFLPPNVYTNTEQSYTNICPDGTTGDPITVTVPAGTFSSTISQEFVDAEALASAIEQANALRVEHPCVTQIPNVLWGWGRNLHGGIGVGNTAVQTYPVMVGYSSLDWVNVKAGAFFTIAIKTDGSLWSWGSNYEGELGQGDRSIFPSTAHNLLYPKQVGTDLDWLRISAGEQFAAAVKSDGSLWTWGYNFSGQLGQGDNADKLVPTRVGTGTDWMDVSCGTTHMLAIKTDGTVWGAGSNNVGELGDGTTTDSSVFVQAGIDSFSSIFTGISIGGSTTNANSLAVKSDGTLWLWGKDFITSASVLSPTLYDSSNWVSVSAGARAGSGFIVGVKSDGTLWGIGDNTAGQLGLGDVIYRSVFTQSGSDTNWLSVSCGTLYTTSIKTDGTLWGCGNDSAAELGQGGVSSARTSFVQMGSDNKWSYVTAGSDTTFALRKDLTIPVPPPINNGVASGGIYSEAGGYSIHRFDSMDAFTVYADTLMDYIVVGGGGAGGGLGGGSAGQFQALSGVSVTIGTYPIVVSQRALRAFGGEDRGEDGGSASFNGTTSVGGLGGGAVDDVLGTGQNGFNGSGGGKRSTSPFTGQVGGTGTNHNGGSGFTGDTAGGGGGGDASDGLDASSGAGGAGGDGTSSSVTGTSVNYAAGGGGGGATTGGAGGSSGAGGTGSSQTAPATPGSTPGSGGGGGLDNFWPVGTENGDGAYGTIIIRYLTPP